jgi:hypothetical protein
VTAADRWEQGSTLIEVLVSVVILGFAITAFLLGMTTGIGSSGLGRDQATGETLLISAGEAVKDQNINHYSCADLSTLQQPWPQGYRLTMPGGPQPPPSWQVTITDVKYWDRSGYGTWIPFSTSGVSCPVRTPLLQGLTITVTSPGGDVTLSRTYVKAAPP